MLADGIDNVSMNICGQVVCELVFSFLLGRISGSYGNTMFNFLRNQKIF